MILNKNRKKSVANYFRVGPFFQPLFGAAPSSVRRSTLFRSDPLPPTRTRQFLCCHCLCHCHQLSSNLPSWTVFSSILTWWVNSALVKNRVDAIIEKLCDHLRRSFESHLRFSCLLRHAFSWMTFKQNSTLFAKLDVFVNCRRYQENSTSWALFEDLQQNFEFFWVSRSQFRVSTSQCCSVLFGAQPLGPLNLNLVYVTFKSRRNIKQKSHTTSKKCLKIYALHIFDCMEIYAVATSS